MIVMKKLFLALILAALAGFTLHSADTLDVYFIDVGHGDAILVDYCWWEALIDAGPGGNTPMDELLTVLSDHVDDETIEAMALSHYHDDHYGGFSAVFDRYRVLEFWQSTDPEPDRCGPHYISFDHALQTQPFAPTQLTFGDRISVGGTTWSVIGPGELRDTQANDNENSLVLLLQYGSVAFLFVGDIQTHSEAAIRTVVLPEGCLILKVAHHGSDSSTSLDFLKWADPELAIVSGDADDLHSQTAASLGAYGVPILATHNNGTICVSTDGESVWVTTDTLSGQVVDCKED